MPSRALERKMKRNETAIAQAIALFPHQAKLLCGEKVVKSPILPSFYLHKRLSAQIK